MGLPSGAAVQGTAVLEASLQAWVRSQAVSQPAVTGSPIGRRTIWPIVVCVRAGFGRGDFTWLIVL
jgi:hypothetical protein